MINWRNTHTKKHLQIAQMFCVVCALNFDFVLVCVSLFICIFDSLALFGGFFCVVLVPLVGPVLNDDFLFHCMLLFASFIVFKIYAAYCSATIIQYYTAAPIVNVFGVRTLFVCLWYSNVEYKWNNFYFTYIYKLSAH